MNMKSGPVTTPVFTLTGIGNDPEHEEPLEQDEPPASALNRRQALVPPKCSITDDYESSHEDTDAVTPNRQSPSNLLAEPKDANRRRSSIVVIPPMQICPGDLLVYSQVLNNSNANSLFGEWYPLSDDIHYASQSK